MLDRLKEEMVKKKTTPEVKEEVKKEFTTEEKLHQAFERKRDQGTSFKHISKG